jgi:hypothetical protein
MKCPDCGSNNAVPYKELRQYIAESGITKEEVRKMLADTIESLCRSALSDKLDAAIENAVASRLRDYHFAKTIEAAIKDAVYDACAGQIEVRIKGGAGGK